MPTKSSANAATPDAPQDQSLLVRKAADALYRGAVECCRQHDRVAKLSDNEEPELEHTHADAMCAMSDASLNELADAYNEIAGTAQPARDEDWWRKANTLWHAGHEYARRRAASDASAKKLSNKRSADQLSSMQVEYELTASALLALRHAAADYLKTRPGLT